MFEDKDKDQIDELLNETIVMIGYYGLLNEKAEKAVI